MNDQTILEIITSFYDKAKVDVMIGYHFRFIEDFDTHIPRIADFWNLQLNGKLIKKEHLPFNLLDVHQGLGIKKGEIGRWLKLFTDTLDEHIQSGDITSENKEIFLKKVEHCSISKK